MDFGKYKDYNDFVDKVETLIVGGDYVKASVLLLEELNKTPNNRWFQLFYITVLVNLNRFEQAKFWLKKIILKYEKRSSQVDVLYYKGLYYFLEGEFKRSMECLQNCFELNINYYKKLLYDKAFDLLRNSLEFKKLSTPSKLFLVNEYISLRLLFSKTLIYVCDELFLTCQKIAISIAPIDFEEYAYFHNIDDAIDFYRSHTHASTEEEISITPEEEFWGHCSNLQAWVENNYNTSILSKYLSFPLLKELHDRGVPHFIPIFKRELIERIRTGGIKTLLYFFEDENNYIQYLTEGDLFDNLLPFEEAEIMKSISSFIPLEYTLTTSLRDSREFWGLRGHKKMHFCVENDHVIELEILLDERFNNEQYHKALLQVKNLRHLKEIEIYSDREFLKALSIKLNKFIK